MKIYEDAFPLQERASRDVVADRIRSGRERLMVGREGGDVVVMALVWPVTGFDYLLLDYVAVLDRMRGEGIGQDFVRFLFDKADEERKSVLLEIEDPEEGDDKGWRLGRVRFFRALGAKELRGVRCVLPPLQGNAPTGLRLLIYAKPAPKRLSGSFVRKLVSQVYQEVYGVRPNDPIMTVSIRNIGDEVVLG